MRRQIIISISVLLSALALSVAGLAQGQSSVPAPEGWKQCPRCQNNRDRAADKTKFQVEGHAFNPRDLSGVWGFSGVANTFRNAPPLTELGKQRQAATLSDKNPAGESLHNKDTYKGSGAQVNCDPPGWPRLHLDNYGFEFIMMPDRVLQFFEITHTWRTIWTDGRKLPAEPPEPRWMGWNVGHWEGDTFVVEGTGFDDRAWLGESQQDGGWPHSDEMKVVERWRRLDYGTLETQITVIDPKTYTQPWVTAAAKTVLVPGAELGEYFCVPSDFSAFNNNVFIRAADPASVGK